MSTEVKEYDIRPKELMQKQKELYQQDINDLLAKKVEFVEVDCPACDSNNKKLQYTKYTLVYQLCCNCGTVYLSPRPSLSVLFDYYSNSRNYQYWAEYVFPITEKTRKEKIFKPRVDLVERLAEKYRFSKNLLVEVGAGYGMFCEELQNRKSFDKVIGIEPTPHLAAICREKGIDIIELPIENVNFQEKADVMVNFEVIEHLFSPRDFLQACYNQLNSNGFLITTCPNIKGFDIMVLGEISDTIDTEHLNYFSPSSLELLLKQIGFEIIEIQTPGKLDVDIVKNKYENGEIDLQNNLFIKNILENLQVAENFQHFLVDNFLSSNMLLVARKA